MKVRQMVRGGLIAALYVVFCFVFAPISYGAVQVRIAEALTLLPVFCPEAVIGVTIGCFLANMLTGSVVDMVVGTLATLLAALATRRLRHIRWRGLALASSIPPVLFNAIIIGAEITILEGLPLSILPLNMLTVGLGQVASCCILGLGLVWLVQKNSTLHRLMTE